MFQFTAVSRIGNLKELFENVVMSPCHGFGSGRNPYKVEHSFSWLPPPPPDLRPELFARLNMAVEAHRRAGGWDAHHPAELEATLSTAMQMGYRQVWAVFQPFTYSRTSILLDDFARVLSMPDRAVITEIMGAREINTYGIKATDLSSKIPGSVQLDTFEQVADYVLKNAQPGDLVLTLGCGDVYKIAKLLLKK